MMKLLLIILFTTITFAQRDKTFNLVAKKPTERITEAGRIKFTKTLNSIQFERYVNEDIKAKITKLMQSNRRGYTNLGTYHLHLVQRKNKLYVIERKSPERLLLLD